LRINFSKMELQQKMFKLVEEWRSSSLSKIEFSDYHNVTYHSLNYWIKKYNKSQIASRVDGDFEESSLSFFSLPESTSKPNDKVRVKNVSHPIKRMEIELGGGIKITIY
jgi:hypothetical protein